MPEQMTWYLMGIKGVAMTSLAQILIDAGLQVRGADLAEDFVTEGILKKLPIQIDVGFDHQLPADVVTVVYTGAHQGIFNPLVQQAITAGIPVLSQAEALAQFHNQKKGIAVCGVGGKSTTSAMITWIMEKLGQNPSFSVGVGNIPSLNMTGRWNPQSEWFVTEADEYVIDPTAPKRGEAIIPRFSFLTPFAIVCTNLEYDHPDVYPDFAATKTEYRKFFNQITPGGFLIMNQDSAGLVELVGQMEKELTEKKIMVIRFGEAAPAEWVLRDYQAAEGQTTGTLSTAGKNLALKLQIPGKFNLKNATAAIAAVAAIGLDATQAVSAIADFPSTMRRFQFLGLKDQVSYYDDYGHHPHEVAAAIQALADWYPDRRKVIAFQSHTFSRTKQLFNDFVTAFEKADEVAMIDIFPSAREAFDTTISSDLLCEAIHKQYPQVQATNYKTLPELAKYLKAALKPGDVCLTIGAGDIYHVHELI